MDERDWVLWVRRRKLRTRRLLQTPRLAVLHRAEVVGVAETAAVFELGALLGTLVEEVALVLSSTWPNHFRKEARWDVFATGLFALVLCLEAVAIALASSVVESVAGSIGLVVIPLGSETVAQASVLWGFANGTSRAKPKCIRRGISDFSHHRVNNFLRFLLWTVGTEG